MHGLIGGSSGISIFHDEEIARQSLADQNLAVTFD